MVFFFIQFIIALIIFSVQQTLKTYLFKLSHPRVCSHYSNKQQKNAHKKISPHLKFKIKHKKNVFQKKKINNKTRKNLMLKQDKKLYQKTFLLYLCKVNTIFYHFFI